MEGGGKHDLIGTHPYRGKTNTRFLGRGFHPYLGPWGGRGEGSEASEKVTQILTFG